MLVSGAGGYQGRATLAATLVRQPGLRGVGSLRLTFRTMLNNYRRALRRGVLAAAMLFVAGLMPQAAGAEELAKVKLALNWKPEPEFGGFYQAKVSGAYAAGGLEVEIVPGGSGTPTVQMVDNGRAEFGIVSADELVTLRAKGGDVVALFTVYQTCPQALMTHADRPVSSLKELIESPGTVAWQAGLPYVQHLKKTYDASRLTEVPYTGGLPFVKSTDFAQQCFVFSEPLIARQKGLPAKTFLIADSGYDPYTCVVVARGDYVRKNEPLVRKMVAAVKRGWQEYLKDPAPANDVMKKLNPAMDAALFADAAKAQEDLILPKGADPATLGTMTTARWKQLIDQLVTYKVIASPIDAEKCHLPAK